MTPPIIMPLEVPPTGVAELVALGETVELRLDGLPIVCINVWVEVGVDDVKC